MRLPLRGSVVRLPVHFLARCGASCVGCCLCEGGLFLCATCGGAEASLPTDCPGYKMTDITYDKVTMGQLDYRWREGGWVRRGNYERRAR